jgi:hypothetical protein
LLLLVIGIGALGFYLDWWRVKKTSHGNEVDITLSVDKDKIKKDTGAAVEQARKAGDNAREEMRKLAGRETVRGKIAAVNAADGAITVSRDNAESVVVHTNESTALKRGADAVTLPDLQPEQAVTVVYAVQDGKNIATSVTVENN